MHLKLLARPGPDRRALLGAPDPREVGDRLRALRAAAGLSQRELARRTGLAHGTISFIERGRGSPSISSLARLLAEFQLTIQDFFRPAETPERPVFFRAGELPQFREGRRSFRLVGHGASGSQLQVHHERYEPGSDTGEPLLAHEGEEAGVVVKGELEVTVAGQRVVLRAGDAYQFHSRLPHRFRNATDEYCEVISVCTPPFLSPDSGSPPAR